jgi:hypothetical protein
MIVPGPADRSVIVDSVTVDNSTMIGTRRSYKEIFHSFGIAIQIRSDKKGRIRSGP